MPRRIDACAPFRRKMEGHFRDIVTRGELYYGSGEQEGGKMMNKARTALAAIGLIALTAGVAAAQPSLPPAFKVRTITTPEGADIFVRSGGSGPVGVLIHGFG